MADITLIAVTKDDNPNIGREIYNGDLEIIEAALNAKIDRDGSVSMDSTLNMNGYRIINLGAGVDPFDPINKQQFDAELNKYAEKNTIYVDPGFANSLPNEKGVGGKAVDPIIALGYISDATTGNLWKVKISSPPTEYSGIFPGKRYVKMLGQGEPIIRLTEDPAEIGAGKARITANTLVEGIIFRADSTISQLILEGDGMLGDFKRCVFFFDGESVTNPDLLLRGVRLEDCDIPMPSLGTITLDGTTPSFINNCKYSVDLLNSQNNDPQAINQKIENLHNLYFNQLT